MGQGWVIIGINRRGYIMLRETVSTMIRTLSVLVLAASATAAPVPPVQFDAAAYDWWGDGLFEQRALIVLDNREGTTAKYFNEVSMTSASWSDTSMNGALWCSPWSEDLELPVPVTIGRIEWSVGTIWYTPGSRTYPTAQPIAFWENLDYPDDTGLMPGYVPAGSYWVCTPTSSGSFFQSPATLDVDGQAYADDNQNPTFDGLPPIPEPVTAMLLTIGAALLGTRRRRRQ